MSALTPVQADAFALLSDNLYAHLDEVDELANQRGMWFADEMQTVRALIGDLVRIIRELLVEHKLQDSGDCQICTSAWLPGGNDHPRIGEGSATTVRPARPAGHGYGLATIGVAILITVG